MPPNSSDGNFTMHSVIILSSFPLLTLWGAWQNVWECLEQDKELENLMKHLFLSFFCNSELLLNRKELFWTTFVSFITQMLFSCLLQLHWHLWEWFLNMTSFRLVTQNLFNKTWKLDTLPSRILFILKDFSYFFFDWCAFQQASYLSTLTG